MAFLISLILGFIPMFIFAGFVNWLDRYEKEPKILLGIVFIWGAVVAAGAAFLLNTILGIGIFLVTGSEGLTGLATGSLIAPLIEESLKAFAVLLVFLFMRHEFDSILDGIVYASIVALGFAATENTYYIYAEGYLGEEFGGWGGLWFLAFVRVILVGWQHPFYTAFFGIGLAIGRLNRKLLVKIGAPLLGLILSMFTHGAHNTISPILIGTMGLGGMALGSLIDWTGWFFMFVFIILMVFQERKIISHYLHDEVELNTITQEQFHIAQSIIGKRFSQINALLHGNFLPAIKFYQLTAELAHKKHQLEKVGEERGNTKRIESLRQRLQELSPLM